MVPGDDPTYACNMINKNLTVACFFVCLPGMTKLMMKLPIALRLILRGWDRGLNVPSEEHEGKPTLFRVGLSEPGREINLCYKWNWNPGPFDPQSSALTNRPPSTPSTNE